ncbi:MAG: helix-turn-helix domain-containing protein [Clostridia bacterium]|jgi:transcriptional regulator with XRE-family HTH domain|nr:helix-turn-helix transcriptional regulator [Clostridiaceae bacterium]
MFAQRLYQLRMEKGLSMKKAGESVGVSDSAWNKYEKEKSEPSLDILVKIADFFDVSTDYLLGNTHIRKPNFSNECFLPSVPGSEAFTASMQETLRLYKNESIDRYTLSTLLGLLTNVMNAFNRMAKREQENRKETGGFQLYQNAIMDLMNDYGNLYESLRE